MYLQNTAYKVLLQELDDRASMARPGTGRNTQLRSPHVMCWQAFGVGHWQIQSKTMKFLTGLSFQHS